jgi:putative oxidoreductase
MTGLSFAALLIARICLVAMFPFSALEKIFNWNAAMEQASSSWVPGPRVMLVLAILVEGITPFCIVFGWYDRFAAFILAGFCVVTAFLYHPFWAYPHLLSDPHSEAREHFWQFLKNFGLIGGLLLVVFAGTLADPMQVLKHPFRSSYADRSEFAR